MVANICYFCLHELHLLPHEFLALPRRERAFVIAAANIRAEREKKQQQEARRAAKSGKAGKGSRTGRR